MNAGMWRSASPRDDHRPVSLIPVISLLTRPLLAHRPEAGSFNFRSPAVCVHSPAGAASACRATTAPSSHTEKVEPTPGVLSTEIR